MSRLVHWEKRLQSHEEGKEGDGNIVVESLGGGGPESDGAG